MRTLVRAAVVMSAFLAHLLFVPPAQAQTCVGASNGLPYVFVEACTLV